MRAFSASLGTKQNKLQLCIKCAVFWIVTPCSLETEQHSGCMPTLPQESQMKFGLVREGLMTGNLQHLPSLLLPVMNVLFDLQKQQNINY